MIQVENRIDLLSQLPPNMICAELGVLAGDFSKKMDEILQPRELILVDNFTGKHLSGDHNGENAREYDLDAEFNNLTSFFANRPYVHLKKGLSYEVLKNYPNDYFNFVYIDTDHTYQGTRKELEICFDKVTNGGYIGGHDYSSISFPDCKKAVDEFCLKYGQTIKYIANDGMPSFLIEVQKDNYLVNSVLKSGFTLLGRERLVNLHRQLDYVLDNQIKGCLVETGVWKGGSIILMQKYLANLGVKKHVLAFDSFQGLPRAEAVDLNYEDKHADEFDLSPLVVKREEFLNNLAQFGIVESDVDIREGWFDVTTKDFNEDIAILRFDGDWYSSTTTVLENMYDRVVNGGVVILDDYGWWKGCKKAFEDFFDKRGEKIELNITDNTEVWFRKP